MYQPKHQKISKSNLKVKKMTLTGIALMSTGMLGTALSTTTHAEATTSSNNVNAAAKPVAKTAAEINQEAMVVIHGDLGNGDERVQNLKNAGFDPQAVQDKVNQYYNQLGYTVAYQASSQAVQKQQTTNNTTTTPAATASQQQASAATSSSDVVNYAANKMAANTGVPASQWVAIIMRESGGNPNAVNASSGAYGLFQLLGHGEYPGMSVDAQIAMATQVYLSQGASAWAATW